MNQESRSRMHFDSVTVPSLSLGLLVLLCLLFVCAGTIRAQQSFGTASNKPPDEDIYVYKPIPDIQIKTVDSSSISLSSLWQSKPLLLTMVFTRCSGVCYPFLSSLESAVAEAGGLGTDYRIVVLSFDPTDTASDMAVMADAYGLKSSAGWIFGVAPPDQIRSLAAAIGFWFRWDHITTQYDHPALIVAIENGKIVRMLAGATVPKESLAEVVQELRGKFIESYVLPGKVAFRCFEYDPNSGRYSLDWGVLLMIFPGAFAIAITLLIFLPMRSRQADGGTFEFPIDAPSNEPAGVLIGLKFAPVESGHKKTRLQ